MPRLIQLRNIKAKDIMSERLIICQRNERLSEVLGRMKKMDIHELPVVEGGKLLGMVSYDIFIKRKSLPLTTMVENLMVTPPKVDVNDSITRVAEVMLVNNFRAVPVTAAGEIAGIVAREDIVQALKGFSQLDQISVADVMSPSPLTIKETDDVEKARAIMRDLDVRTLPVVDSEERLTGVLGVKDIMAYYGKERGQRRSAKGVPGDTVDLSITVGSLMNSPAISTSVESDMAEVVKLMADNHISSVVVVDKEAPTGIVTHMDMLELVASYQERRQVYIQITGLEEHDPDVYDEMYGLIERRMQKITPIAMPQLLMLHFTEHHHPAEPRHYSIRARLSTNTGLFFSEGQDFDKFR
ncbi:MAG: CBS domain-containing protein, partial [Thermoplasmata archaeon]|nr:CBS domain-containing protein [Thermoplasmata archaeon]NIS12203.1 CBS domain-containing protein [Thermoplasmata archaeon]NIS20119.1 CBS domain-containing protein [Thermoplasmata archaeon]NIT77445.1 CBS domain-containing protein [Thermoplasmata archaeon]NIU49217.1 CBS domain-containing protein [Thermoplasmata archaeon]